MRLLTKLEQEALNLLSKNGLTAEMLINLNLPEPILANEKLESFTLNHLSAMNILIQKGFSIQMACDEIKELNAHQCYLIEKMQILGSDLRNLHMGSSFAWQHRILAFYLKKKGFFSAEICSTVSELTADQAFQVCNTFFNVLKKNQTLQWQCIRFFSHPDISQETREHLMKKMPESNAKKVALAVKLWHP